MMEFFGLMFFCASLVLAGSVFHLAENFRKGFDASIEAYVNKGAKKSPRSPLDEAVLDSYFITMLRNTAPDLAEKIAGSNLVTPFRCVVQRYNEKLFDVATVDESNAKKRWGLKTISLGTAKKDSIDEVKQRLVEYVRTVMGDRVGTDEEILGKIRPALAAVDALNYNDAESIVMGAFFSKEAAKI